MWVVRDMEGVGRVESRTGKREGRKRLCGRKGERWRTRKEGKRGGVREGGIQGKEEEERKGKGKYKREEGGKGKRGKRHRHKERGKGKGKEEGEGEVELQAVLRLCKGNISTWNINGDAK